MSRKGSNHNKRGKSRPAVGDKAREVLENIDENNRVIQMFKQYKEELDDKHDRYEKIVKMSRDITIETKRIIFLLHSFNTDIEEKREATLEEAETRLNDVITKNFKNIAILLKNFDHYQYHRAYTSGIQEFIEALTFYKYLKNDEMETFDNLNKSFQYEEEGENLTLLCPHGDFILGIADFTGEMMRRCINNLGIGNVDECFKICEVVKDIYTGFLGLIHYGQKELGRKIFTLKQSVHKMELVCYNIKIRGSEVPKHLLVDVIEAKEVDESVDEGFF